MPNDTSFPNNTVAEQIVMVEPVSGTAVTPAQAATKTIAIPSAQASQVIKATPGRLHKILVTATGAGGPTNIYDNASAASGTIVGVVPASAAVGTIYDLVMPCANGIYQGTAPATSPAFTISYS